MTTTEEALRQENAELRRRLDSAINTLYIVGRVANGENRALTREAAATAFNMWRMAEES